MSFVIKHCVRQGNFFMNGKNNVNLVLPVNNIFKKYLSDKSDKNTVLSSSTILMQDGLIVQELPVIVKKVTDIFVPYDNKVLSQDIQSSQDADKYKIISDEFEICPSVKEVLSLLSKCGKITPNIALGAVERIFRLNKEVDNERPYNDTSEYTREMATGAVVEKLTTIILKSEDSRVILNALKIFSSLDNNLKFKFCDEVLVRVTDNKLSVEELCEFVTFLSEHNNVTLFRESIDKLWTGFSEKMITENNIVQVYSILTYLNKSRRIILNMVEKRLSVVWWKLSSENVQELMDICCKNKVGSVRSVSVFSRWMNLNIHTFDEEVLLELVTKFTQLNYNDNQIEKALERYVKIKGIKINNHSLIVAILNHCVTFRVRNNHIMNGCVEYFMAKGSNVPAIFLKSFLYPFGFLYYQPQNGVRFWEILEKVFEEKFLRLDVEDVLDIMLSCIYLNKYPLNFVNKVFNPRFLDRINSSPNVNKLRTKLKLIDTAMSLESKAYKGPLLPKDHWAKSLLIDGRIKRITNNIRETLEHLAGGPDCLSLSVVVPYLFTTELYIVDVLIHPRGLGSSILNLNLKVDRNIAVAVLIHPPEHYCSMKVELVGPQNMRKRHLKAVGMKVVDLDYDMLMRLQMHRVELEKYVAKCLKHAEASL